jgi:integrase
MKPRQLTSGRWEIELRHPSLPKGRKSFTFDSEEEARRYQDNWQLMKQAKLAPPQSLLQSEDERDPTTLKRILLDWERSHAARTQKSAITCLLREVGAVRLQDADIKWLEEYIRNELKMKRRLTPHSITLRIHCLKQAIDNYLRLNQHIKIGNVTRLLPVRYAHYSDAERRLLVAAGHEVPRDQQRDRRLHPGEEARLRVALAGGALDGRPNRLHAATGPAMLALFDLIVNTGLRLLEAFRLKRADVDLERKVIRAQMSKLWHGKVAYKEVPISPALYEALRAYLSRRAVLPQAQLFPFLEEEEGLTTTAVTVRLSLRFARVFDYAGCPDLHEHDLRHEATCRWFELRNRDGSWMFRSEEIRKIMGWSANSNMPARYASFRAEDLSSRLWLSQDHDGQGRRDPAA